MAFKLPGWAKDNRTAVLEEVAEYVEMPIAKKAELVFSACQTAEVQLAARTDAARMRAWQDPLPASTLTALERLRRERDRRTTAP